MSRMTEDTKRALEIMQPVAEELNIKVEANGKILKMDGQAIGIACNSTWATLMEMIGWIFLERYCRGFREIDIDRNELNETIKRYWISPEVLRSLGVGNEN